MSTFSINDLKRAAEAKHSLRMNFLDEFEIMHAKAAALGYNLVLEDGGLIITPSPPPPPVYSQGIPKKADLRLEDDRIQFQSVAEAIDFALERVNSEFSTADVLGQIREVAPAFYNNRDLSSFSHQLKKQTQNGRIVMMARGAGNKSSRYVKRAEPSLMD